MSNEYEIPKCPVTLMCGSCMGLGTLGGSSCVTESCFVCKGTGMVQREADRDE